MQTNFNKEQIDSAFKDLDSLKERSRNMVAIAEQIKSKLARKELNVESDEIKEIQAVMFNMGISGAADFSS
jgi:di/tripeptidase